LGDLIGIGRFLSVISVGILSGIFATILYFIILPKYLVKEFEYKILLVVFMSTYIIPILFLLILKRRNNITDFHLKTIKERKLPIFFFTTITLLLAYRLLETGVVNLLAYSFFGVSLAMLVVFVLFFKSIKTSIHTLAIGGLTGFVLLLSFHFKIRLLLLIAVLFLVFGIIAYARLKMKAHTSKEVYLGFFIGVFTQILVYYFVPFLLK